MNGSDLMAPSPALIEECFILAMANSAFATFRQDNGKFIQQKAEGNVEAIAQMEADIRSVMVEAVREAVTGVNPGNGGLSRARIQEIAREKPSTKPAGYSRSSTNENRRRHRSCAGAPARSMPPCRFSMPRGACPTVTSHRPFPIISGASRAERRQHRLGFSRHLPSRRGC